MRVLFSTEARRDLIEIADFIAEDSPKRAKSFVIELRDRARNLATMPKGFPLVRDLEQHEIRRRPHGDYLIFYHVRAERIEIIRILRGARDYESLLFPDG